MQQISMQALLLGSVIVAALLIYVPFLVVAYGRVQIGMEAIAQPRAVLDKLPSFAKRATWAHQNSFEAFVLFAAAALMAYVTEVDSPWAARAAIAHVIARLLYSVFYILNIPIGRSLMFGVGSLSTATLMALSFMATLRN
ncbi:MAPEG family protein [Leptolyngbya sp. AN02str]|uniref:MAPEG family protein n=1 Tax=Leptolyngbya sp. AN02str TaxID=3423363 RepID=UPI003D316572